MHPPSLLFTCAFMAAAASTQALTAGTVTTTADSGGGSLRAVLAAATNGETITFDPALNGATITLTSGELAISGLQVSIDASALSSGIKISGNNTSRIFSITGNADVSLKSCELFHGKNLNGNGGGIFALQSNLNFTNVTIRSCASSFDGGAIWANSITGQFDRCSYLGNDADGFGGGIFLLASPNCTFINSVFSGNRSPSGGGVAALSASPTFINCTIQGNSGVGIHLEFASAPVLRNTIIQGNRSGEGSISSQQIRRGTSSTATANVDYCLVEGASATLNNLDGALDPKFINPAAPTGSTTPPTANSDLRVLTNSPVLNVGNNGSNATPFDRAGNARIQNTTIDLGAFEGGYVTFALLHPALSPTGDENGNGLSNFLEYATGIDPTAPDDSSVRPQISTSGGFRFLTSSRRSNAADTVAIWQTSPSLLTNTWLEMLPGINYTLDSISSPTPSRQQVVIKLLDTDPRRFYRQKFTGAN